MSVESATQGDPPWGTPAKAGQGSNFARPLKIFYTIFVRFKRMSKISQKLRQTGRMSVYLFLHLLNMNLSHILMVAFWIMYHLFSSSVLLLTLSFFLTPRHHLTIRGSLNFYPTYTITINLNKSNRTWEYFTC